MRSTLVFLATTLAAATMVVRADSGAPPQERVALKMTLRDSQQRTIAAADAVVSLALAQKVINRSATAIDSVMSRPSCSPVSAETETMSFEFSVNDQLRLVRAVPIRVSLSASGAVQPLSQMALTLAVMYAETGPSIPSREQGTVGILSDGGCASRLLSCLEVQMPEATAATSTACA